MGGLIGVDWGSTNFRAFRFDAAGAVIDRRTSSRGAAMMASADFATVLNDTVADWPDGDTQVVLAEWPARGMDGGRRRTCAARQILCIWLPLRCD